MAISHDHASRASFPVAAVIHHGVRPEDFPVGTGSGEHLLFLGRFSRDKGAREAALIAHAAQVPLIMAAKKRDQAEIDYFEKEVAPLLDDQVRYVGEIGKSEKLDLLGSARALLNPIRWPEPFGLAMIESLACGTPVLTLRSGAAPEIVRDGVTGFLCDSDDDLVTAIGRIDQLDRAACRRSVETYFCSDRMVDQYLRLYEDVVARWPEEPDSMDSNAWLSMLALSGWTRLHGTPLAWFTSRFTSVDTWHAPTNAASVGLPCDRSVMLRHRDEPSFIG